VIAQLAANYPLPRTNPNATPVADILKPKWEVETANERA
jgi:hypothetical protein